MENLRASADAQPTKAFCIHCPRWKAVGTAEEVRGAAEEHRREKHPETFRKPKPARRRAFSRNMTKEREAEIEEERRQRMRMMGLI